MMRPVATLDDVLDMVQRRAPLIIGILILGFLTSTWLGLGQRPVYRAQEIIQTVPPRVVEEMAMTSVQEPILERLPLLKRHLLSDTVLSEIATAYDLFDVTPVQSAASKTDQLREAVSLDWSIGDDGEVVVTATAEMDDAEEARLVAGELGHRLVNLSAQMRIGEARSTFDFLTRREAELTADLGRLETRYANFLRSSPIIPGDANVASADDDTTAVLLAGLNRYQRDLDRLRNQLDETADRRERAQIGLDLEVRRQSERLVVSAPAERPDRPITDVRGLIVALGGMLSACIAFGLAWTLEWFNPVMRSAEQMQRMTGITPLVAVPHALHQPKSGGGWRAWTLLRGSTSAASG